MRTQQAGLPDGTTTVIEWFDAPPEQQKGLVAFLPALGVGVDYYRGMAEAWAGRGYQVASVEMRGMRQSSVRNVRSHNFGYNEVLNVDLATLLPRLREEAQGRPFYLAGHSLGGQFALLHASRHAGAADGVILLAGGSNYHGSMPGSARLKRHFGIRVVRLIDRALGFFPGDKLGFGGRQPLNMMLDWTHEALTGRYRVAGDATDYDGALGRLELPVLLVSLSGDPLVPKTCGAFLARKLERARVTHVELQAREHGLPVFHHFRWVRRPEPLLDQVDTWVQGLATGGAGAASAGA